MYLENGRSTGTNECWDYIVWSERGGKMFEEVMPLKLCKSGKRGCFDHPIIVPVDDPKCLSFGRRCKFFWVGV